MFEIAEDEFALPFFKDKGFSRRKCNKCGSHFWAKGQGRQTCGEVPCEPYTFIGNSPSKRSYDVREMRIQFLDFFAERGHTRIKPYPIVARWRDDVYLVGASIYDFQPYVTEGTMPPPANPLVISQPCIRFTDIEQVGPTAGRHGTFFEMGGHHAFNNSNKEVYWKDETVSYHHQLLVNVLGVPEESVTYKEHFWSGGGNAGPDLEGIVNGMEISTLVFMQYKVEGDQLTPTRIRTVDTGYGIERWSWLSQGSPSGFHAVYGPLLKYLFDLAKIDIADTIITASTKAAGAYYSKDQNWRIPATKWICTETGLEETKVRDAISMLESAYALADHSKTLSFLLADGVVPSNVGEGYLARLIIRRAARLARILGIFDKLPDIVEAQLKHWSPDFRVLHEMRNEIMEGLLVETKKYQETLAKGSEVVARLSKEVSGKGKGRITSSQLVQLYDSHGLPPEIVKEEAEKVGVEVEIPENFLSLVAERHSRPSPRETEATNYQEEKLRNLPPTRTLYYDDPYEMAFKAKIVARPTETTLVLDQTCFYPQGGGQPGDQGELRFGQSSARVVDVQKLGGTIVHFLDRTLPPETELVEGEVDWPRRQSLMRHHTATHTLLGAARRVLGEHVWQAGAQKDVETSRLDITHYREITEREKERIERLVNQVILRNLPVQANWLSREKAESKYGFRLYQGGVVPGSKIRVVRIANWDAEACGGTHCKRTGELGIFKLVKVDRLQDGVERIIFSAGEAAFKQISKQGEILAKTSDLLNTPPELLLETVTELVRERDGMAKDLKKLREKTLEIRAKQLARRAKTVGPIRLVIAKISKRKDVDPVELANRLKEHSSDLVAVIFEVSDRVQVAASVGDAAVKAGINASEIVGEAARVLGGGGGGRPFFATGGGPEKGKVDEALAKSEEVITRQLSRRTTEKAA